MTMTRPNAAAWILIYEALKPRPLTKKELGKELGWPWLTLTKYVDHFIQVRCLEWTRAISCLATRPP